ncbi:MAG: histidinol dehydrogenase, partial [Pseudoalteromonas distincta]
MLRWNEESSQVQAAALMRPAVSVSAKVEAICKTILVKVKEQGDEALLDMAKEFDNRANPRLRVPLDEINASEQALSAELKYAIDTAYANVKCFHEAQLPKDIKLSTQPGVVCELKYQAIEAVGIYVPGGSAPLPSSVIMQGVLAQLSGAKTVVLATPVQGDKAINPAILYAAKLCGITTLIESGGAGAI